MIKCHFCGTAYEETLDICQPCLDWLEADCVPGPSDKVTGHDRGNALRLLDSIQAGEPVTASVYDLIRKCIARGAEYGECCCKSCRPHVRSLGTQMVAQSTQDILEAIRAASASVGVPEAELLQAVVDLHSEEAAPALEFLTAFPTKEPHG